MQRISKVLKQDVINEEGIFLVLLSSIDEIQVVNLFKKEIEQQHAWIRV